MAIQEQDRAPARADGRFRLGRGWRKTTLIVHIVSAGAWIGIDVMVAVLVLTGRFGTSDEVRGLGDRETRRVDASGAERRAYEALGGGGRRLGEEFRTGAGNE